MTRGGFASRVMRQLNVPLTPRNRRAFQAWIQSEGGAAKYNPLNTTLIMPGSSPYNSVGVRSYASAADGVEATVRTFHERGHGYEPILYHLRHDDWAIKTLIAVGKSDWGTGGNLARLVLGDLLHIPGYLRYLEKKEVAS